MKKNLKQDNDIRYFPITPHPQRFTIAKEGAPNNDRGPSQPSASLSLPKSQSYKRGNP